MKTAWLKRQHTRQYVSCLFASPSPLSSKRSANAIHPQQLPHAHVSSSELIFYRNFTSSHNPWSCHGNQLRPCNRRAAQPKRLFSAVPSSCTGLSCIENTPLGGPKGAALLQGLDIHTIPAEDDGHPLAVYTIEENGTSKNANSDENERRTPVLLLHGRTWSSVPVYHLVGESNAGASEGGENRSLIQALYNSEHIQPYAMDFRGFGGTPKDESGFVEPLKCVSDVVSVLNWIHEKHNNEGNGANVQPALLGWSHGALIAQITAQRCPEALSKLILYGSLYNPNMKYAIPPAGDPHAGYTDHEDFPLHAMAARNEYERAMEDFTHVSNEARIFPPESARLFAEAALVCDPFKVQWGSLHQLNECHPSLVKVPTMVIAGDQDIYAPMQTQTELFTNLGRGADRVWNIIANADHAVHLSDERHRLVENMNNFLQTRF